MANSPFFRRSQARIPKGKELGEVVTIEYPAIVTFSKLARRVLDEGCKLNSLAADVPRGFMALMLEPDRTILLKPINQENEDAFEVKQTGLEVTTNLYELMAAYNVLAPKGYRQHVPIEVRASSPVGPCLALRLDEATTEPINRRDDEVAAGQQEPS